MASYGHAMQQPPAPRPGQPPPAAYGGPIQMMPATAPPGTFASGTRIQVGSHRVVIQKYLSEGGFAHVYLVKMPTPVDGTDLAVLKRVAVPDKDALRGMRTEVETMKRLKGHKPIVTYIDSHASELRGGGYEVFLLMEYCNGGGLIDFMNTRLQHRLTEPEILNIFSDVAEGVACMHYLKPPLLHRDLKVENVLITTSGSRKKFKLCDFGSASAPKPAPVSVVECRLLDEDLQKHTTLQYRSPEMIDVYRKQPIDEKSDIWALGVLLYKLCYYTTPFEDQGQLAILNASYRFPSYPVFSDRLKKLIASMLKEHQESRPNIYQVLRESCAMQGREVPIKDIYSGRSRSEPRGAERAPITEKPTSTPVVGAVFAPPPKQQQVIPEVVPMRRGRPQAAAQPAPPAKPNPSPMRVTNGDPFAALDTKQAKLGSPDELSSRFPTLDQFSLLHDQGSKFSFDDPTSATDGRSAKDLNQKVADKLADDAFSPNSGNQRPATDALNKPYPAVKPEKQVITSPPMKSASAPPKSSEMSRASAIISSTPELQAISSQASHAYQSTPGKPVMVSTGTMTSTPPPERPQMQYQIYHFPAAEQHRSSSLPRQPENLGVNQQRPDSASSRPSAVPRAPSFQSQPGHVRHPSSSRPSLEGARPSPDLLDPTAKPVSQPGRPRPVSTHLESNMDYLREKESAPRPLVSPGNNPSPKYAEAGRSPRLEANEETNIESNVEFLRSMEDPDSRKEKTHPKQGKRASLSGTKHILAGRFGDAFKRFEGNTTAPPPARTPSPLKQLERQHLEAIAGSEATDGRSDDGEVLEETDDMTPEARREIERRRLSMEEKRVAAAGAEYRQRIAQRDAGGGGGGGGVSSSSTSTSYVSTSGPAPAPLPKSIGGVSRAVSIQNRVQSLLQDSQSSSTNVARTAEGYGRYADNATAASRVPDAKPEIARKPVGTGGSRMAPAAAAAAATIRPVTSSGAADLAVRRSSTVSSDPTPSRSGGSPYPPSLGGGGSGGPGGPRPMAKPKPTHLNKNLTAGSLGAGKPGSPTKPPPSNLHKPLPKPPPQQQLVATDLPGQPALDMSPQEKDDYLRDFAKRYPSLTSIEMVERDLAAESHRGR